MRQDYWFLCHTVELSKMHRALGIWALLGGSAAANFDGNLNYRSPSSEHPPLGIDVNKVVRRQLAKRDNTEWDPAKLAFTHGVASVSEHPPRFCPDIDSIGRPLCRQCYFMDSSSPVLGERPIKHHRGGECSLLQS